MPKSPFQLPFRGKMILACIMLILLTSFYVAQEQIQIVHNTLFRSVRLSTPDKRRCPIPVNKEQDVCIRSEVSLLDLESVCGTFKASVGNCQERSYGMIVTTQQTIDAVRDHTYKMVVQKTAGLGEALDAFVQRHSRWVIDSMGFEGYEVLTTFGDEDRLALQRHLDQLQNRCDRFFYGATNEFGFGSAWHTLGLGLALSVYYNQTLLTPVHYKHFIPLTTCTEADKEKAFTTHPPETDFGKWDMATINMKTQAPDVFTLMHRGGHIHPNYEHKGHFWWRSMLTYYAIRPNAHLRSLIRDSSVAVTPCISIHVRHSDKFTEATLLPLSNYMEAAQRYKDKTGVSTIYLMTDDHKVIEETKNYPLFQFHYLDLPRSNKGWEADVEAGITREQQEASFLVDIYSAVRCQHNIVTYSSNVGRLIGEIAYAIGDKEPDVYSLDSAWGMIP